MKCTQPRLQAIFVLVEKDKKSLQEGVCNWWNKNIGAVKLTLCRFTCILIRCNNIFTGKYIVSTYSLYLTLLNKRQVVKGMRKLLINSSMLLMIYKETMPF